MEFILLFMGGIFFGVGLVTTTIFSSVSDMFPGRSGAGAFIMIPLLFTLIGAIILGFAVREIIRKSNVRKKGTRYPAKVYGYVDDTSFVVNGQYTVNIKVRFFDSNNFIREAIIPTQFNRNSSMYGIGMTIDIFEYNGRFSWDKKSARFEKLPNENQLMDERPVNPDEINLIAVTCPYCGANFKATSGYTNRCPYCDGYINA